MRTKWFKGVSCLAVTACLLLAGPARAQAPAASPRTIADLLAQLDRDKPDPAKVAEAQKLLESPPPPASELNMVRYNYYNARARAWAAQARAL